MRLEPRAEHVAGRCPPLAPRRGRRRGARSCAAIPLARPGAPLRGLSGCWSRARSARSFALTRDADPGDAADPHRPRRRRRLPRPALEHRGRGPALCGALAAVLLGSGALELPAPLADPAGARWPARWPARSLMLGPALLQAAVRRRRGRDHAAPQLRRAPVRLDDARGAAEGPDGLGWPQSRADPAPTRQLPQLVERVAPACGLVVGDRAGVRRAVRDDAHGARASRSAPSAHNRARRGFAGIRVERRACSRSPCSRAGWPGSRARRGRRAARATSPPTCRPASATAGIVVAMLAGLHPLGVVPAAMFVGGDLRRRRRDEPELAFRTTSPT